MFLVSNYPCDQFGEAMIGQVDRIRRDPVTGKTTCVILQVEDELAAVGAAVGAGWGGLRAMTATSGPGISLMTENIGLAYFAEIPLVIWDVQRVGPSTGLPTRTAQAISLCCTSWVMATQAISFSSLVRSLNVLNLAGSLLIWQIVTKLQFSS